MSQVTIVAQSGGGGGGTVTSVSGGNNITITGNPTIDPTVNVSGTTNHSVLLGNSTGSINSLAVGATGTILAGVTSSDPSFTSSPTINGTVTVFDLAIPNTNSAGTQGVIIQGGQRAFHNFPGQDSMFVGSDSGNFSNTGSRNSGFGQLSLNSIATGTDCTAVGNEALFSVDVGSRNSGFGSGAGAALSSANNCTFVGADAGSSAGTGSGNSCLGAFANVGSTSSNSICIGLFAGSNATTGSESENIYIGNAGVASESNTTRLGAQNQQDTCFVYGIEGVNIGSVSTVVSIDSSSQLGEVTLTAGTNMTIVPTANTITFNAIGGPLPGVEVTSSTTQTMAANTAYISNNSSSAVTFTLPTTAAQFSILQVINKLGNNWIIAQNAGQSIILGISITTAGVSGSLGSNNQGDSVTMICTTANTQWTVISSVGNAITVV